MKNSMIFISWGHPDTIPFFAVAAFAIFDIMNRPAVSAIDCRTSATKSPLQAISEIFNISSKTISTVSCLLSQKIN